jgi:hypothetical protein
LTAGRLTAKKNNNKDGKSQKLFEAYSPDGSAQSTQSLLR